MSRRVSIIPGTLRDVSWITANMRPLDRQEAFCQMDCSPQELAAYLVHGSEAYVACLDGKPTMAFGWAQMAAAGVSIWAIGTRRAHFTAPEITRFFVGRFVPRLWKSGIRWGEARSIATHKLAHNWMKATGAVPVLELPDYGKDGEDFILFRWRWTAFEDVINGKDT